jgi:hypothetical protein
MSLHEHDQGRIGSRLPDEVLKLELSAIAKTNVGICIRGCQTTRCPGSNGIRYQTTIASSLPYKKRLYVDYAFLGLCSADHFISRHSW